MAIILFRKGGFKICNEFSYEHELEDGWYLTKEEAEKAWLPPKVEEPEEEPEEETEEEVEKEVEVESDLEAKKQEIIERLKAKKLKLVEETSS